MSHTDRPDPNALVLDSGKLAATAEDVLNALAELGIEQQTIEHQPVYTLEEAKAVHHEASAIHTKNLLLRNKKGHLFLVMVEQDRAVSLEGLRDTLKLRGGQLAFAGADRMEQFLGVVPGSVTPLAIINDPSNNVEVIIERALFDEEWIYVHPCRNTQTTRIRTADLKSALQAWGHEPRLFDF